MLYRDYILEIKTKTSKREINSYFDLESNYYISKTIRTSYPGNLLRNNNRIQYIDPSKPAPEKALKTDEKKEKGEVLVSINLDTGNFY